MAEYIDREALRQFPIRKDHYDKKNGNEHFIFGIETVMEYAESLPAADVAPVRHGYWILESHKERVNSRWNVTAECSECCDEEKEIWVGFFPGVPDSMAREIALMDAEQVKLSNFCPNCGAKMDGDEKC